MWTAELVISIEYLHAMNVVFRDLKPENILLDTLGHVHMTDFGLSKVMAHANEPLHTFCGTPYYLAPEMLVDKKGYGQPVDWWGLGILVFEMLSGQPPFYSNNMQRVYEKIVSAEIAWPAHANATPEVTSLVNQFLQRDPAKRLGTKTGAAEIKAHPFFAGLDWVALNNKQVTSGYVPRQGGSKDSRFLPKVRHCLCLVFPLSSWLRRRLSLRSSGGRRRCLRRVSAAIGRPAGRGAGG